MLKKPTIHAAIAPDVERDLRFAPRDAISVATLAPRKMLTKPNGFMLNLLWPCLRFHDDAESLFAYLIDLIDTSWQPDGEYKTLSTLHKLRYDGWVEWSHIFHHGPTSICRRNK